jgi:hypothetical protein
MKNSIHISLLILLFIVQNNFTGSFKLYCQDLDGWQKWGSKPEFYDIGIDDEKYNDKTAYFIKSNALVLDGFGTIAQSMKPDEYLSKRVRMSSYIRTINVTGWVGMWMRVDGNEAGKSLQFDNMGTRPIKSTTDWQKYEIVLDVPANSSSVSYGILIGGEGEAKFSDLKFEVVDSGVASTNMKTYEPPENNDYSVLPEKLKDIPDGIIVKHTPDTVYAEKTGKDTIMYYWNYVTMVKASTRDLEITEFGAYSWVNGKWNLYTVTGKPFTNRDFREWYHCKKGMMKTGKEYSDKSNWNRNALLQKGKALWYYIGRDANGNLYKGTAIVDYMAEEKK